MKRRSRHCNDVLLYTPFTLQNAINRMSAHQHRAVEFIRIWGASWRSCTPSSCRPCLITPPPEWAEDQGRPGPTDPPCCTAARRRRWLTQAPRRMPPPPAWPALHPAAGRPPVPNMSLLQASPIHPRICYEPHPGHCLRLQSGSQVGMEAKEADAAERQAEVFCELSSCLGQKPQSQTLSRLNPVFPP